MINVKCAIVPIIFNDNNNNISSYVTFIIIISSKLW